MHAVLKILWSTDPSSCVFCNGLVKCKDTVSSRIELDKKGTAQILCLYVFVQPSNRFIYLGRYAINLQYHTATVIIIFKNFSFQHLNNIQKHDIDILRDNLYVSSMDRVARNQNLTVYSNLKCNSI